MPRVFKPLTPADPQAPIVQSPPKDLGPDGRRLWRQMARLPWVGASDSVALHEMCRMADQAQALRADVEARGVAYEARGRIYSNPSLAALHEVEKALAGLLSRFGATPADRGRLGVKEPPPPGKLELLEARRERRKGQSSAS